MTVISKLNLDLARRGIQQRADVVQGDCYTRMLEISLYEDGTPWDFPDGASALLRFRKDDGTGGMYDTLPDGTRAWSAQGNAVSFMLAPQVLSVPGAVQAQLEIVKGSARAASFTFWIEVVSDPSVGVLDSEDYVSWNAWALQSLENLFPVSGKAPGVKPALWFDTSQGAPRTQLTVIDQDGEDHTVYPVTKMACVDGLDAALASVFRNQTTNGDFDRLIAPGWAWCQLESCTNGPASAGSGFLEVIDIGGSVYLQRFTKYYDKKIWVRTYVNSAWSGWVRVDATASAPAGYGLGEYTAAQTALTDADLATLSGWYKLDATAANGVGASAILVVDGSSGSYVTQTAILTATGYRRTRCCIDGTWSEWDWIEPPKSVGYEYRTAERYGGKAVYVKRISYTPSAAIGSSSALTDVAIPHDITGYAGLVRCFGRIGNYGLPNFTSSGSISVLRVSSDAVYVRLINATTQNTLYFDLYYTKE